jgi:hypothetical protein
MRRSDMMTGRCSRTWTPKRGSPSGPPIRIVRRIVNEVLADAELAAMYSAGRSPQLRRKGFSAGGNLLTVCECPVYTGTQEVRR